ncbi:hypothetical protein D3C72_1676230 [compost metagenome]
MNYEQQPKGFIGYPIYTEFSTPSRADTAHALTMRAVIGRLTLSGTCASLWAAMRASVHAGRVQTKAEGLALADF